MALDNQDQALLHMAKLNMSELASQNNGKMLEYEQKAYNCIRLLSLRLETALSNSKTVETVNDPSIKTKVLHSESKSAWNVIGTRPGTKHKIARIPYYVCEDENITERNRIEALEHAKFIAYCFNNSDKILPPTQ